MPVGRRHPYLMPQPEPLVPVRSPPCGFAFIPALGLTFLSFSDSIRSARRMGRACVRPSNLLPASMNSASRNPLPTFRASPRGACALRIAPRCAASWLPCQHYRFSVTCFCLANPVTRSCTAAVRRFFFSQGIAELRSFRSARLPPPPSHSSPPRCIGFRERTQP